MQQSSGWHILTCILLCVCSRVCIAFVTPTAARFSEQDHKRSTSVATVVAVTEQKAILLSRRKHQLHQQHQPSRRSPALLLTVFPLLATAGSTAAGDGDDPFRPERASVSPMIINALVRVLFRHDVGPDTARAEAIAALEQRSSSSDLKMSEEEERAVIARVCGVTENLTELRFMLATAVGRYFPL